jgi:hypothetical protein
VYVGMCTCARVYVCVCVFVPEGTSEIVVCNFLAGK